MDINLKNKIQQALNSDFIGIIDFSEEEIEEMYNDCKEIYRTIREEKNRNAKSYLGKENIKNKTGELVVCFVCTIKNKFNLSELDENKFYSVITKEIFDEDINPTFFYDIFLEIFEKYNKPIFISPGGKRMYRVTLLAQALMPYKSTYEFVKLLYTWYTDNTILNFNYKNKILLEEMTDFLHDTFSKDTTSDNSDIFGHPYAITAPMRYLFTQNKDNGKKIIDIILKDIHKHFNDCEFENPNYIQEIIRDVLKNGNTKALKKNKYNEKVAKSYNDINLEYRVKDGSLYLFVPRIFVQEPIKTKLSYELYENNKLIFNNNKKIVKGNDLKRYIDDEYIELNNLLTSEDIQLRLKIYVQEQDNNKLVFDSDDKLFRKYILFTKNGKESKLKIQKPNIYIWKPNVMTNINPIWNNENPI